MKITEPGIYRGISEADYRADPCPIPSLTQSLCKIALERSMRSVRTASPSLNPNFEPDDDTKFDLGNTAHTMILGRGKEFEVVDFDYWSPKAKLAREEAAAQGRIAVLRDQHTRAAAMAAEARAQLDRHEDRDAFTGGDAEVMIAWQEDGIWCRALVDWLHTDLRTVDDYKSTAMSVAPHLIGFRALNGGWDLQAAFIARGLDVLDPAGAGRRRFRFVAQETDPPHDLAVMHMTKPWMTMGDKKVRAAMALWRAAAKSSRWPGYGTRPMTPEYPAYQEKSWLERELSGEFENNNPDLIFAG
jgi:hypothetical protein